MQRLVTGEFNSRAQGQHVVEDLVQAGVPRDQIFIETELPPDPARARKGPGIDMAEAERRIAGTETGTLVGAIFGLLGGLLLTMVNEALHLTTVAVERHMAPAPFNNFFTGGLVGLIVGAIVGAALGAVVDFTLTRLGAGPAKPREECLVTVRTDDEGLNKVCSVFLDNGARHVLGAELAT